MGTEDLFVLLDHPTRLQIAYVLDKYGENYNANIASRLIRMDGVIGMDESTTIRDLKKLLLNGIVEEVTHPETDKKKYYKITEWGKEGLKKKKHLLNEILAKARK